MNIPLFIGFVLVLSVFYFVIGIISSRNIRSTSDYFLAGKGLGIFPIASSLIATQIGAGMLLGTAEKAYNIGIYGIFYTLGMSLGFMILSTGIAGKLQQYNISTIPELFEKKYHSRGLKYVASTLSSITLSGILVSQIIALKFLLHGLGVHHELVFIAFWSFIVLYTIVGGLTAVVFADMAQVAFIITAFIAAFIYSLLNEPNSFFTLSQQYNMHASFIPEHFSLLSVLPIVLVPALFSLIQQDLAQRFFAAKTPRVATTSAFIASIVLLAFSLVPIYFGMKASLLHLQIDAHTNPLIAALGSLGSEILYIMTLCGIVAAITSTADSLLCALSLNIADTFNLVSRMRQKHQLFVSKIITLLIGIVVLIASYLVPQNIIDILIGSYELSVSCMFVPLFICYFKDMVKKRAAIGAVSFGLVAYIGLRIFPVAYPNELISLAFSLLGYFIGSIC